MHALQDLLKAVVALKQLQKENLKLSSNFENVSSQHRLPPLGNPPTKSAQQNVMA